MGHKKQKGLTMNKIFRLLSILIIALAASLAIINPPQLIALYTWGNIIYITSFTYLFIGVFIVGLIAGIAWMLTYYFDCQGKFKEYKKKLEKTTVTAESDSSKVDVLEAKIEVLEKALKSALEKNND